MTHLLFALAGVTRRFAGLPLLVVGDAMLDRYIYGEVERISPEGPVPVFRVLRESAMLGGAGNVVRNLAALEARPRFVSVVGDDQAGQSLLGLLADEPAVVADVAIEAGRQTTIKTRYVAAHQQMLRADQETVAPPQPATIDRMLDAALAVIPQCAAIVLSDYGKGVLTPDMTARLIEAARAAGRPVVVDPKGADYRRYRGATVITPNRRELAEATRLPTGTGEEIVAAARHLLDLTETAAVLVTRSQEGMTLVTPGGVEHIPAEAREVFDVSGAGDTVTAMLALALAAGAGFGDAARLANAAAGIVVGKAGTATVRLAEVEDALRRADLRAGGHKLVDAETAARLAQAWRAEGLRVGFTNGCFDLLHPGHVSLLAQARAECDRLIVGLNSDASVRRLKGEGRPVQNEFARAIVLSSLATVDLVVIFEEDTPMRLLQAVRPDLLMKGADYTVETVVGAEFVQSYGGSVRLADLAEGYSTTRTINNMRR